MRRFLFLILLGTLLVSGCGPQPQDCARREVYCIGLVTDYGPVDSSIAREAWAALQEARDSGLADRADYIETIDTRDRLANIKHLAENGYDLIVTAGAPMGDATTQAAGEYPRLKFIGIEQPQAEKVANLTGLVFREDFAGFLAGALAARMSDTGQVAAVCEARYIDSIRRYCDGFVAGARHTDPGVGASATYRDGPSENLFNDPAWGRLTALQQIEQGADVIFAAGGQTADSALEAAVSEGVYVIGSETDRYADLPQIRAQLLTSATNDVHAGLLQLITLTRQGRFPAGEFVGTVKLAPWHEFERQIAPATRQELDRLHVRLALGIIPLHIPYKNP